MRFHRLVHIRSQCETVATLYGTVSEKLIGKLCPIVYVTTNHCLVTEIISCIKSAIWKPEKDVRL